MKLCLLIIIAFFGHVICNETDHNHEGEDVFDHLVELVGNSGVFNSASLDILIDGLRNRITCNNKSLCDDCLSETKIGNLTDYNSHFNETTLLGVANHILLVFANETCPNDNSSLTEKVCKEQVNTLLGKLALKYEPDDNQTQCFNHHTLITGNCTDHGADVVYAMLADLYEGKCVLPNEHQLEEEIFEHIGAANGVVNDQALTDLLTGLGIGVITNSMTETSTDDHADHDHKRKRRNTVETHEENHEHHARCYSRNQLKSIFGFSGNLTEEQVLEMCPAFVQQILEGSCTTRAVEEESTQPPEAPYTDAMKYGYGTASVGIISALAFVGIFFFPVLESVKFKLVMQFFIALGVGTMSGDAILHIIPEVTGIHDHGATEETDAHDHEEEDRTYLWRLLVVIAGVWVFFLFENGLKLLSSKRLPHSHGPCADEHHTYTNPTAPTDNDHVTKFTKFDSDGDDIEEAKKVEGQNGKLAKNGVNHIGNGTLVIKEQESKREEKRRYFWGVTAVGIMVFFGDVLHNFGDGIAIGAAFSESWVQGVGTSLAIVFHELPHEFGDFAIYMNNGLTKWRALAFNFAAACCAFIGLYIGIAISSDEAVRGWILSAVAGMFLYVSLVNVLHEMVCEESFYPKLQFLLQNLGLVLGWGILLVIAIFEEDLVNSIQG
ncbi:unnamed protein product [Clavelina lepadiformis]|uniref:Zinc transporter ZIP4/12 EF-hand domain-containing protein n=2 Tax=Clavelina lepadiformis TaxID=159417 RepID=A0ABP0FYL3_CLALP